MTDSTSPLYCEDEIIVDYIQELQNEINQLSDQTRSSAREHANLLQAYQSLDAAYHRLYEMHCNLILYRK
jgi:hypothetical protein